MKFSSFGDKFAHNSGIHELMDDLDAALNEPDRYLMLGGGNPGSIGAVEEILRGELQKLLADGRRFDDGIGRYHSPAGESGFLRDLARLLQREYGWRVGPENILLTNGSQHSFFNLFNLFAGRRGDGSFGRILLPLIPEYIGYADLGIESDIFRARIPRIEMIDEHTFKYRLDFDRIRIDADIAAICLSRPTNPSGNVVTDEELDRLRGLARERDIPLIVDSAYGPPFPDIVFVPIRPVWDERLILTLSLSKFGLPGVRTGIIVASAEVVETLTRINAITALATGNMGPLLAGDLVRSGEILRISRDILQGHYRQKSAAARAVLHAAIDPRIPYALHSSEGAFFLWAWFRDLPVSDRELYRRLKERGVIVVPGHYYFPGLEEDWSHREQCIRISFAREEQEVERGLRIIAEEINRLYAGHL